MWCVFCCCMSCVMCCLLCVVDRCWYSLTCVVFCLLFVEFLFSVFTCCLRLTVVFCCLWLWVVCNWHC